MQMKPDFISNIPLNFTVKLTMHTKEKPKHTDLLLVQTEY